MTKPTFPAFAKLDLTGLLAIQKANVEAVLKAQRIVSETTRAALKLNTDWLAETAQRAVATMRAGAATKPEAFAADVRTASERALAVARQELDLGVRARGEVVDLMAKRAAANLDEVKALAAAA